jgi:hypothetical protein
VRKTPKPPLSGWAGYPLGVAVIVGVTVMSVAAHATSHPLPALWVLTGTTAAVGAVTTLPAGLATAAVGWCLYAGFVLGRLGELQFSAESARAAALLATVTLVAHVTGVAVRVVLLRRRRAAQRAVTIPAQRRPALSRRVGSRPA